MKCKSSVCSCGAVRQANYLQLHNQTNFLCPLCGTRRKHKQRSLVFSAANLQEDRQSNNPFPYSKSVALFSGVELQWDRLIADQSSPPASKVKSLKWASPLLQGHNRDSCYWLLAIKWQKKILLHLKTACLPLSCYHSKNRKTSKCNNAQTLSQTG